MFGIIEQINSLIFVKFFAFLHLLNHIIPILLLNHALQPALAYTLLINSQMAQTVVLEVESELKLPGVATLDLDMFPLELQLGLPIQEEQVAVYPGHLLLPRPVLVEQLDQDVRQKDLVVLLEPQVVEPHPLVDQLLVSSEADVEVVVFVEATVGDAFQPVTDQFVINFGHLEDGLDVFEVSQLAGLVNSVSLLIESLGIVKLEALEG